MSAGAPDPRPFASRWPAARPLRGASEAVPTDPLARAARAALAELRAGRQRPMLHWTIRAASNGPWRRLRRVT